MNRSLLVLAYRAIDRLLLGLDIAHDPEGNRGGYSGSQWDASVKYARKILEKLKLEIKS